MKILCSPVAILTLTVLLVSGCSDPKSSFATEDGVVLRVFSATDSGYEFIAYAVNWNGSDIIVSDPLGKSHHAVGETVEFIEQKTDAGSGIKVLSFTLLE